MAFTGVAVVTPISDRKIRITGLSLAGDASGTIGFTDKTVAPEVAIGLLPMWQPYELAGGTDVTLIQCIEVRFGLLTDVTAAVPVSVVKTGTTHLDFVATLHNDSAATVSGELEIWIEFH